MSAVVNVGSTVLDATTGIPSMVRDVQTVFSGNSSWLDKALAVGDFALNVAMDVSMLVGVGEVARGLYLAAHVAGDIAEHMAVDTAEHATADVVEHAAADVVDVAKDAGKNVSDSTSLYHYTNESGMQGIVDSKSLNPSKLALNPKDARYGDGQYLTDIAPGSITKSQTTRRLFGIPWGTSRVSHFVKINVEGLTVLNPKENVFLIPGDSPLDLTGRIVGFGSTP